MKLRTVLVIIMVAVIGSTASGAGHSECETHVSLTDTVAFSAWRIPRASGETPTPGGSSMVPLDTSAVGWENLRNLALWNTLWDVYTLPGTECRWAVGGAWYGPEDINLTDGNPVICRSGSGASEWEIFQPEVTSDSMRPANIHFYTIHFVNELKGWAGGEARLNGDQRAIIFHTLDGGLTWDLQYEGAASPHHGIVDIIFIDSLTGWAVGSINEYTNIAILKTDDGGETWLPQPTGINAAVTEVDFINEMVGLAGANLGYTLGTVNGGQTWTIRSEDPDFYFGFFALDLVNHSVGFAANTGSLIYRTTDTGLSWELVHNAPRSIWDLHFLDNQHGWGGGDYGTIVVTNDGGNTWETMEYAAYVKGIKAVSAVDSLTVWVVGGEGSVAFTDDGGSTWQQIDGDRYISSNLLKDCDFVGGNTGWVVGQYGEMLHTADGGRTWVHQNRGQNVHFSAVDFIDSLEGWAGGAEIWHSEDGGQTWQPQAVVQVIDICFVGKEHGWASGIGAVYRTDDGGITWDTLDPGTDEGLYGIHFVDDSIGWCVGWNGTIVKTTNAGTTWVLQTSPVTGPIYDVAFVDKARGWAVGINSPSGGFILHTDDGGITWEVQHLAEEALVGVDFMDDTTGCAAGGRTGQSLILATDDGATWTECDVRNDTQGSLNIGRKVHGVRLLNANTWFAVGEHGSVWRVPPEFLCGDVNGDGDGPNIVDVTYLVAYLFGGGPPPPVPQAADVNGGDGKVNIVDLVYLTAYLFDDGPAPDCGE